jgi:cytochrome P450
MSTQAARAHIEEVISGKLPDDSDQTVQVGGKPTIFRQLARNSSLTGPQWSADRLTKEAQILMGAGSVSPARTLHFIAFYLLSNYHMRKRLEEELSSVMCEWPDKIPALSQLERLPYLQALIKEGLR